MPTVSSRYAAEGAPFRRPSARQEAALRAPVVLMVSGGADSTALLLRAATSELDVLDGRGEARVARERLHVLHVNHRLRGIDAEEDEEFVRGLAERFGVPCTVESFDVARLARERFGGNVENAGRELRYAAANRLADELSRELGTPRSAARILTAHTADDRAETFLMNAIRGAGASGLSSIPRRRGRVVRPLLDCTHEALCQQLRMAGIVWREDATNADTRQLRSFVRHEILPVARRRNARVVSAIASGCDILSDEDSFMERLAAGTLRTLERRRSDASLALDAGRLAATEVALARRVVRRAVAEVAPGCRLEARHVAAVLRIVAAGEGSATVPMGVDARVEYGLLFIRSRDAASEPVTGWLEVPGEVALADGRVLRARTLALPPGADGAAYARAWAAERGAGHALLDAEACGLGAGSERLFVDTPQPGDVICPLGMHGQSKKLSDLLNEAKVPAAERPGACVVRTGPSGRIVWVAGIRVDERAKCLPSSRKLVELSI